VSELKSKLSAYLAYLKKVARSEAMVRSGQIRPPRGSPPSDFWTRPLAPDPEGLGLRAILEEREQGR
jgi:hypothetical protein